MSGSKKEVLMKKLLTSSAIMLMALFTLAPLASAFSPQEREERQREEEREERNRRREEPRFRLNFGFGSQPYGYRYGYQPYGYGYQPYGYGYTYSAGVVRIHFPYQAQVWVDDNFVGDDIHNVTLSPGTHEIELRDSYGNITFEQNVNVIGGRTIDLFTQGY
jgi:cbb3-type cytochrome oxidase subunit 3